MKILRKTTQKLSHAEKSHRLFRRPNPTLWSRTIHGYVTTASLPCIWRVEWHAMLARGRDAPVNATVSALCVCDSQEIRDDDQPRRDAGLNHHRSRRSARLKFLTRATPLSPDGRGRARKSTAVWRLRRSGGAARDWPIFFDNLINETLRDLNARACCVGT